MVCRRRFFCLAAFISVQFLSILALTTFKVLKAKACRHYFSLTDESKLRRSRFESDKSDIYH